MAPNDVRLHQLFDAIAKGDEETVSEFLMAEPGLAQRAVTKTNKPDESQEYFLPEIHLQIYAGDTALHVAAASYNSDLVRQLIEKGADIRAKNRRGAEPLHSAMVGSPGSDHWNPEAQAELVLCLVGYGADPNAVDVGGVTPLHRASRNRCSSAVRALLEVGADARLTTKKGTTALQLARHSNGRGGTGSQASKVQQRQIMALLEL